MTGHKVWSWFPTDTRTQKLIMMQIKMKVYKTVEDHERDANREKLLEFLNSSYS